MIAVIMTLMMVLSLAGCGQEQTQTAEQGSDAAASVNMMDPVEGANAWADYLYGYCDLMNNSYYTVDRFSSEDFDGDGEMDLLVVYRDNFEACFSHMAMYSYLSSDGRKAGRCVNKLIKDDFKEDEYTFYSNGVVVRDYFDDYENAEFTTVYDMMGRLQGDLAQSEDEYVRYVIWVGDAVDTGSKYKIRQVPVEGKPIQLVEETVDETYVSSMIFFSEMDDYTSGAEVIKPLFSYAN